MKAWPRYGKCLPEPPPNAVAVPGKKGISILEVDEGFSVR